MYWFLATKDKLFPFPLSTHFCFLLGWWGVATKVLVFLLHLAEPFDSWTPGSCKEIEQLTVSTVDFSSVHEGEQHLQVLLRDIFQVDNETLSRRISLGEEATKEGGADWKDKAVSRKGWFASGQCHISQAALHTTWSQHNSSQQRWSNEDLLEQLLCNWEENRVMIIPLEAEIFISHCFLQPSRDPHNMSQQLFLLQNLLLLCLLFSTTKYFSALAKENTELSGSTKYLQKTCYFTFCLTVVFVSCIWHTFFRFLARNSVWEFVQL